MKNIRVWYKKYGACRYISHLDVNRAVMRAMQMSQLPLWHTEGFNSRMYISFALPLSLGFTGSFECMDMRLTDDNTDNGLVIKRLNECLPDGIEVYDITDPVMKPAEIAYARFKIRIMAESISAEEIYENLRSLLEQESITTEKKTKKGDIKQVDIKQSIKEYNAALDDNAVVLEILLPAGNNANVNPTLLTDILAKICECELFCNVERGRLYNDKLELFI